MDFVFSDEQQQLRDSIQKFISKEYGFEVTPTATKGQIREALKQRFGVTATSVRTMQMRRNAMARGQSRGVSARWKKAYVTLKDGESLAVFEG